MTSHETRARHSNVLQRLRRTRPVPHPDGSVLPHGHARVGTRRRRRPPRVRVAAVLHRQRMGQLPGTSIRQRSQLKGQQCGCAQHQDAQHCTTVTAHAAHNTTDKQMPGRGRPWDRERKRYKDECRSAGAECWLCHGRKGPIDYTSKFNPDQPNPLLFTIDHVTPTSLGGDVMRKANWRPCHASCNTSRGNGTRGQFPTARKW